MRIGTLTIVGVGLYLVGRLASLQGGRAWVEGRPGGGASFKVHPEPNVSLDATVYLEEGVTWPADVGTLLVLGDDDEAEVREWLKVNRPTKTAC